MQANIFFLVASIATVVFCVVVVLVLIQIYKIVKLIRSILERIESASEVVAEDVTHIRELVTSGGIISAIIGLIVGQKRRGSRKKTTKE